MKLLFAASESAPYIKTGGLGDVAYALPKELASKGVDTSVVIPLYKQTKEKFLNELTFLCNFGVPLGWRTVYCGVFTAVLNNVTYYFIDNEYYFNRNTPYGECDDGERFAFFSKAILEMFLHIGYYPDVIHANDWQTALIPIFLKAHYSHLNEYSNIKTVFTIHNIEYQGKMPFTVFTDILGLHDYWMKFLHYGDCLNYMYSAIVLCDKITTVSRSYANEITDSYFSHGMHHALIANKYKIQGVVNGIDTAMFNPQTDKSLFKRYSIKSLNGKAVNKAGLQEELGLKVDPKVPIIAMITRLVSHKGIDLVKYIFNEIVNRDVQIVILGTGDKPLENFFSDMSYRYPDKVCTRIMFDGGLANKIYAGADMFLMPSKSEPCGLSQLISMRYATVPIVREIGGLKDTVPPFNKITGEGTGFTFKSYNAHDMLDAINRACETYYNKDEWTKIMKNDISFDSSWNLPAGEYIYIYSNLLH